MKKFIGYTTVISAMVFMLSSCLEVETLPNEPSITFKSLQTYPDSAILTIGFKDGDGDVGLGEADTIAPFDPEGPYYFNLLCDYFEKQHGEWVKFENLELPFYYRVPRVTPTGQNPTLNGEMKITMAPLYYIPGTGYDTCRFEVKIYDRSLNPSNEVVTTSFIKP